MKVMDLTGESTIELAEFLEIVSHMTWTDQSLGLSVTHCACQISRHTSTLDTATQEEYYRVVIVNSEPRNLCPGTF